MRAVRAAVRAGAGEVKEEGDWEEVVMGWAALGWGAAATVGAGKGAVGVGVRGWAALGLGAAVAVGSGKGDVGVEVRGCNQDGRRAGTRVK